MERSLNSKFSRIMVVSLAAFVSLPGAVFSLIWLAAHIFSDTFGTYVYADSKHPHYDSWIEALIYAAAALSRTVAVPFCVVFILLWLTAMVRPGFTVGLRLSLAILAALSVVGTYWLVTGMH